jgi:hypothetical protein
MKDTILMIITLLSVPAFICFAALTYACAVQFKIDSRDLLGFRPYRLCGCEDQAADRTQL